MYLKILQKLINNNITNYIYNLEGIAIMLIKKFILFTKD